MARTKKVAAKVSDCYEIQDLALFDQGDSKSPDIVLDCATDLPSMDTSAFSITFKLSIGPSSSSTEPWLKLQPASGSDISFLSSLASEQGVDVPSASYETFVLRFPGSEFSGQLHHVCIAANRGELGVGVLKIRINQVDYGRFRIPSLSGGIRAICIDKDEIASCGTLKNFRVYCWALTNLQSMQDSESDVPVDDATPKTITRAFVPVAAEKGAFKHEMEALFRGDYSDMVLIVGEGLGQREFPGHSAILGPRCGYIDLIKESKFEDRTLKTLSFPMFDPKDFEKFLRVVYLEEFVVDSSEDGAKILSIFDYMQMNPLFLRRICSSAVQRITPNNFFTIVEFGLRFGDEKDQRSIKKFFSGHFKRLVKEPAFYKLHPDLMKALLEHHAGLTNSFETSPYPRWSDRK